MSIFVASPFARVGRAIPPGNLSFDEVARHVGFYDAVEAPLTLPDGTCVPDHKALLRGDDGSYLSTVGKGYKVVQFRDLAEAGMKAANDFGAIWHTAGLLGKNGVRGWLLADLGDFAVVGDRSPVKKYVLLHNAHDGTTAATLMNAATRVVCENTLGVALSERDGARWTIRHTANALERLEDAAKAFRRIVTHLSEFEDLANVLARTPYTDKMHAAAIQALLPLEDDGKKHPRIQKQRERMSELFETFIGAEGIRGTAWGAFQAWAEHADHDRNRLEEAKPDKWGQRLERIALGSGADLKAAALTTILRQLRGDAPVEPLALAA